MDLGIVTSPAPGITAQIARLVESLGFDSLALTDSQNMQPDVWGQLMLAAGATKRIMLGTGVTNATTRECAVTASALMGLHLESSGRAFCGIGRGASATQKVGKASASLVDFDRYLGDLRRFICGKTVRTGDVTSRLEWIAGNEYEVPAIDVAATGPKVIELATKYADQITFCVGANPDRLSHALKLAQSAATKNGRKKGSIKYGAHINCVIHQNHEAARNAIRGSLAVFAMTSAKDKSALASMPEHMRSDAKSLHLNFDPDQTGDSASVHARELSDEFVDWFGIVGPIGDAQQRFAEIAQTGMDYVRVMPGSSDMAENIAASTLIALSRNVLPSVK